MVPIASVGPNAYSALDIASAAPASSMKAALKAHRSVLESAKASHLAASASVSAPSAESIVSNKPSVYLHLQYQS